MKTKCRNHLDIMSSYSLGVALSIQFSIASVFVSLKPLHADMHGVRSQCAHRS